jgi:3-oxoadipate enol-lactonase
LRSESHRIVSDDAEIAYHVVGSGPTIIFLHAFPAHHAMWMPVADAFASRYRCILPDLRGHGESGTGNGPATMEKHARDIERVCGDAGADRAAFVGVSIGGYILLEFWRRFRERVAALALCDTRAQADSDEVRANRLRSIDDVQQRGPDAFLDSMLLRLLGSTTRNNRPDRAAAARAMMAQMTVAGIVAVQQGMAARPDSVPTLRTITAPTLIVVGDEDVVSPVPDAELMRQHVAHSRLEIIAQGGHYAPFEQPEAVTRTLRHFLDGQRWS